MIPHERSLVERLKNEPFALVGVNTDKDHDVYRTKAKELGVTWRSAMQDTIGGPISKQYRVRAYPTLFLIDAKGVIRHSWLGGPGEEELDREIDLLVKEAKSPK